MTGWAKMGDWRLWCVQAAKQGVGRITADQQAQAHNKTHSVSARKDECQRLPDKKSISIHFIGASSRRIVHTTLERDALPFPNQGIIGAVSQTSFLMYQRKTEGHVGGQSAERQSTSNASEGETAC